MFLSDHAASAASKESFLAPYLADQFPWLYADSTVWTVIGLVGGGCFGIRFVIQWLHSEKAKRVVVPDIFWYLSFVGSIITLIYAFHIDRLPIVLGLVFSPFLYGRNLVLLHRHRKSLESAKEA
ncbi:MAG: lipid-A-disaccharide synthase N-terminal domain-containing protein [Verrucomicrobiae bacterium]|jgi:lipid-A-disaccharide synthase-like uncharacterized protein|nr:lipid-A-disaccharide synthase N-terminal domain-containing protein [Verrucomicrobiae bacterium]